MNMIFCNEISKHFWKYTLSWLIGYILTSRDVFYFLNVQAHCVYMTCYLSQCWPTFVVMIKDIHNNKLLEIWAVTKWQKSNYQKYGQWQSNKNDQKNTKIIKKNGQWQMIRIIEVSKQVTSIQIICRGQSVVHGVPATKRIIRSSSR